MNIRKFRVLMAHDFFGDNLLYDNQELWLYGITCDYYTDKTIELLDKLCNTKKNADIFFSCYKSPLDFDRRTHNITHMIYEQPEPYASERLDNWNRIKSHLDSIVQKFYGKKHWGEQKVVLDKTPLSDDERQKADKIIRDKVEKVISKLSDEDYRRILTLNTAVVSIR